MVNDHLQRGRDNEEPGDPLFKPVQHAIGCEFGLHNSAYAGSQRHDPQTGSADVRAWHADEDRFIIIPARPWLGRLFRWLA